MKINFPTPALALAFIVLYLNTSCSKDSDLLAEYVISDAPNAVDLRVYVVDDVYSTTPDNPIVLDVLSNDNFTNVEDVKIIETSTPSNGVVEILEDKTISYTPGTTEVASVPVATVDTFTYTTEVVNEDTTVSTEVGTVTVSITEYGELKAFPSAYGGGAFAKGGRGGKVIHVTNLNSSGSGSFREALLTSGARTIVFDVSGNIDLQGSDIRVNGHSLDNLTIAGQTAPMGGITFTKGTIFFDAVNNVVIRYLRGRPAEATSGEVTHGDALIFWGCNDIILDHVSVSFGGDQTCTFNPNTVNSTQKRQTLQRSIIGDSFTGIIMGGNEPNFYNTVDQISFLNNLVVDITHRTPNMSGDGNFESINNVIYNWSWRLMNLNGGRAKVNHIGNYHKRGRATEQNSVASNANKIQLANGATSPLVYTSSNYYNGVLNGDSGEDNRIIWTNFSGSTPMASSYFTSTQFPLNGAPLNIKTAKNAYNDVLGNVGANAYFDNNGIKQTFLDDYDSSKINNVKNDISRSNNPDYSSWNIPNLPNNGRPENYDIDKDGMADAWERSVGLNPNNANDANEDRNGDGYTNLEDFLNQVDF